MIIYKSNKNLFTSIIEQKFVFAACNNQQNFAVLNTI